jgi:hypothetical protein
MADVVSALETGLDEVERTAEEPSTQITTPQPRNAGSRWWRVVGAGLVVTAVAALVGFVWRPPPASVGKRTLATPASREHSTRAAPTLAATAATLLAAPSSSAVSPPPAMVLSAPPTRASNDAPPASPTPPSTGPIAPSAAAVVGSTTAAPNAGPGDGLPLHL